MSGKKYRVYLENWKLFSLTEVELKGLQRGAEGEKAGDQYECDYDWPWIPI